MCGLGISVVVLWALSGCVREPSSALATASPTATETEVMVLADTLTATATMTGTLRAATPAVGTLAVGGTRPPRATATPILVKPHSAPATPGKAYVFQLSTRCGIDYEVDFDGSFWDAASARPVGIGSPTQKGTMTLIDTRHAKFSYDKGVVSYTRHTGVKTLAYLC